MYLPQNDISEVVLRQRNQKQELSKVLLKNKTKLTQVQQEIRFLTQPLNTDYVDECERLDDEIDKLRRVCQAMLNEIEYLKRQNEEPRQPIRPAPPPPPHPPPRTRPHNLFSRQHSPAPKSPVSPQNPRQSPGQSSPSQPQQQEQTQPKIIDPEDACDANSAEQPWQCSMCTFQNHWLLNKCECCDNVRILPGSVRIVPSRPSPSPPTAALRSRSAPQTPATPSSARILTSLPNDYSHSAGAGSSNSEGNLSQFAGDVVI